MFPIIGNWVQCNFIYLLWLTVGKSSFLQNITEEIRPGCRNLQRSQIMVNLSERVFVQKGLGLDRNSGLISFNTAQHEIIPESIGGI